MGKNLHEWLAPWLYDIDRKEFAIIPLESSWKWNSQNIFT